MIDEYIKELITNNNRVIIPNFGAFLLRATSKNKNKKDLAAKVEDVYFSPFLKFNDELLVNHIIKQENIDQQKAMDKINQYIKQVEKKVQNEGIYKIEGLGEFTQDNQGKIQFKVIEDSTKITKPKEEKLSATKKTAEKKESKPKTVHEKASETKKTTDKIPEKKAEEKAEEKKPTPPPQARDKGRKTPPPKPPIEKSKSGTNKGLVLSIAIGLPIVVLFIWAMLNFDTVQKLFDKNDQQITDQVEKQQADKEEEKEEKANEEETSEEKTREEEQRETEEQIIEEKRKEQDQVSASKTKKFHIVAGSFEKRQNAVNYRDKLRKEGFNAELIGERDGMHAVSYSSFDSKSEATEEMKRIKEEEDLQAWLLYY
ncbi:MAG: SPOR domain-containing protein [Bacteroidales bacterium]